MDTMVLIAPGARIWHADGMAATVIEIGITGVLVRIDGERAAVPVAVTGWALALSCDYCPEAAEVQLRDGQPGDVLCKGCTHAHFDRPADWVRPIPRTVIRALHGQCQRLA